jgi:hypothetical protein
MDASRDTRVIPLVPSTVLEYLGVRAVATAATAEGTDLLAVCKAAGCGLQRLTTVQFAQVVATQLARKDGNATKSQDGYLAYVDLAGKGGPQWIGLRKIPQKTLQCSERFTGKNPRPKLRSLQKEVSAPSQVFKFVFTGPRGRPAKKPRLSSRPAARAELYSSKAQPPESCLHGGLGKCDCAGIDPAGQRTRARRFGSWRGLAYIMY